jgi:PKD repeat protein
VKLPFSIGPHGSATIYMAFNGSGWSDHWGEAPTLSTPYGAHDNGRYVFLAYGAFGSGFDGWAPGVFTGSFSPTPSGGGILLVNNQGGEGTYLVAPGQLPRVPLVVDVEWGFNAPGGETPADALAISIGNAAQQIAVGSVGGTDGGGTPAAGGSIFAQNEFYPGWPVLALKDAVADQIVGTIPWQTGQVELVYSTFTLIPPKGNGGKWGAMAGYAIVGSSLPSSPPPVQPPQTVNLLDAGTSNSGAPIPFAVSAPQGMDLELGAGSGGATAYTYVYWALARAYPPDDVMPTSTLGAPMVPVNVTNYGPVEVRISQVVVVSNGAPTYYPYSATLFPGQSVVVYAPLSGSMGFETDSGVVWTTSILRTSSTPPSSSPPPLSVNFFANPTSGSAPLTVQFTGSITGGSGSYSWTINFGDGSSTSGSGSSVSASHTYGSTGTYTATLTVKSGSQSASQSVTITVTQPTYSLTFTEYGLPPGATWWASVNGQTKYASAGQSITFNGLSGTSSWSVESPVIVGRQFYWATPSSGTTNSGGTIYISYS